jgi:hypothetical protein
VLQLNCIPASASGVIVLIPIAPTANAAMIANTFSILVIEKSYLQDIFNIATLTNNDLQWFTMDFTTFLSIRL